MQTMLQIFDLLLRLFSQYMYFRLTLSKFLLPISDLLISFTTSYSLFKISFSLVSMALPLSATIIYLYIPFVLKLDNLIFAAKDDKLKLFQLQPQSYLTLDEPDQGLYSSRALAKNFLLVPPTQPKSALVLMV